MAVKSKLQYWSGSAWVDAVSGSNNNPLIRVSVDDKMGQPQKLEALISNRAPNPFSADAADAKGGLTGVFTDFMKVRLIDPSTQIVYFLGRLYRVNDKYDMQFGSCIEITAFDALQELKNNVTDGHEDIIVTHTGGDTYPTPASLTTSVDRRSGLAKGLISLFSKSGNISVAETQSGTSARLQTSQNTFASSFTYNLKKGGNKSALSHLSSIAKDDSHDAGRTTFTYDYYVDPNVQTRAAGTEGTPQFNYFKRGSVPVGTPATYGLRIEYPAGGGITKTGRVIPMMADYDFNKPKDELFTEVVTHYKEEGVEVAQGSSSSGGWPVEKTVHMELIKVRNISGAFTWSGKAIGGGTIGTDSAESLTLSGNVVGKIQWMSASSGGSAGSPEFALVSDMTNGFPASGTLTGATSSATFIIVSRPKETFGVIKIARLGAADISNADVIREQAVARLKRSTETLTRGRIRIHQKPSFYVESSSTTVSSNTITFGDISALISYGLKQGATVNKVSATGVVQAYGYVTAFTNNSVTIDSATGISNGDTIRVNIPVRASNLCYIVNRMVGITGSDFLITEVNYVEDNGVMTAELELVEATNGMGARDNPIGKAIENVLTNENYKEDSAVNPKDVVSTVAFTLGDASGNNKHRDILYSTGNITVGGNTFKVVQGVLSMNITSDNLEQYIYHTGVEGVTSLSTALKTAYDFDDKDRLLLLWVRTNDVSATEDLIFSTDPLNPNNLEAVRGGFNGSKGLNNTGTIKLNQDLTAQSISFISRTAYPRVDFTTGGILGKSDASTVEFSLDASNGKGMFGGGVCTIGRSGIYFPSPASDNTAALAAMEWNYNSKSTWLYRYTGTNIMRWTSDADTPAEGRMDFVNMDIKLSGGDFFDGSNSLAALYGGSSSDAQSLHTHGNLGGGGGSGDITAVLAGAGISVSGGSSGDATVSINYGTSNTWSATTSFTAGIAMSGSNNLALSSGVVLSTITPPQFSTGAFFTEMSAPSTPNSGYGIVYAKTDSKLYYKSDGGTEYDLTASSGGGVSYPLTASDGSAAAPSYSFSADTNTGMYRYGDDRAALTANGQPCLIAYGNVNSSGVGGIGINEASPTHRLHVGGVCRSIQTTFATSSDERVKENIIDMEPALDTLLQLKPRQFNFTSAYRPDRKDTEVGFIAQEVKAVIPTAVELVKESYGWKQDSEGRWETDNDNQTVIEDFEVLDTSWLLPMLVKAVQELKSQNNALSTRIQTLEGN